MSKVFAYLRASTTEQNAQRAKSTIQAFASTNEFTIGEFIIENVSGASADRVGLHNILSMAEKGDVILVEQIDRLTRLHAADWKLLKIKMDTIGLRVVSMDLPTSWKLVSTGDATTDGIFDAINSMMMDILAVTARKDYEDRRRRQAQGISKAKDAGVYKGRIQSTDTIKKCKRALELVTTGSTKQEAAAAVGVGIATLYRYIKETK